MALTDTSPPELERPASYGPWRGRSRFFCFLLVLGFLALSAQLWRLQIVDGRVHLAAAQGNSLRTVDIPALRGVIFDRNREMLAFNAPTFIVSVTEADLPAGRRASVLQQTAQLLGTTVEEIEQTVSAKRLVGGPFTPIVIKADVSRDVALTLEQQSWELPGVYVTVDTVRRYVEGEAFSHIIGYTALPAPDAYTSRYERQGYEPDERVGAAGVEATYESDLHGRAGQRMIIADVGGRPLSELERRPPQSGNDLQLTIDATLQRNVYRVVSERLIAHKQNLERAAAERRIPAASVPATVAGAAIVMDPRNGEILALASVPGYDANIFYGRDRDADIERVLRDPALPLFNRAIDGQYPPGSTFKLVTGIGALEERTASRSTTIDCNGELRIPNPYNPQAFTRLPDWGILGRLDFVQGLAQSCNVYFYTLGGGFGPVEGLGNARLGRYARLMGYGEPTGVDLPSEVTGRIPTADWKQSNVGEAWLPGDTYNMAIGQGFVLATPLQVAMVTNAIAMNGTAYRPHVVRAVVDGNRQPLRDLTPEVMRRAAFRPDTLAAVREGMVAVLETPQTRANRLPGITVAGKTGTAEFPGPRDEKGNLPTHGWFTAFAPAQDPRVSVTVFLERGGGPSDALPVAMAVLREYLALYP